MKSTHTYVHNIKTIVCEMAQLISQVKYLTIQNLLLPWVHNGLSSLFLGYNQVEFNKKKYAVGFFSLGEAVFLIVLKMPSMFLSLSWERGFVVF